MSLQFYLPIQEVTVHCPCGVGIVTVHADYEGGMTCPECDLRLGVSNPPTESVSTASLRVGVIKDWAIIDGKVSESDW